MPGMSRTSAVILAAKAKQERALELRLKGLSMRAIAKEMGCGTTAVHTYIKAALAESAGRCAMNADQLREVEAGRLDMLFEREAAKDSTASTLAAVRVAERKAKLLNLDLARSDVTIQLQVAGPLVDTLASVLRRVLLPEHPGLHDEILDRLAAEFNRQAGVEIREHVIAATASQVLDHDDGDDPEHVDGEAEELHPEAVH